MYQLERSSTNRSKASVALGVQYSSNAAVISPTSCAVLATSHASSGCVTLGPPSRSEYDGRKSSMFA